MGSFRENRATVKKCVFMFMACILGGLFSLSMPCQAQGFTISTIVGTGVLGYAGDGAAAAQAQLRPACMTTDSSGNLYIADTFNSVVRVVYTNGTINTFAGNGSYGYSGDGGPASNAQLASPCGMAFDQSGDVFIADTGNNVIREVTPGGNIVTAYGSNTRGFGGDGGAASSAQFYSPTGLAMDSAGNLYISDSGNHVIRQVDTSGVVNTIAGMPEPGYSGDGGPAIFAQFYYPKGLAIDSNNNLYVADYGNSVIRVIALANDLINTVAGNGTPGFFGDGGPAASAELAYPYDIAVDNSGNVYIADLGNQRIREVSNGAITTIAGNGTRGYSGDGGSSVSAQFNYPGGVAIVCATSSCQTQAAGLLYIADWDNNVVRVLTPNTGDKRLRH